MKGLTAAATCAILIMAASSAHAYRLPAYSISAADRDRPTPAIMRDLDDRLGTIAEQADISKLDEHKRNPKIRLSPSERASLPEYEKLKDALEFWGYTSDLASKLASLHGSSAPAGAAAEADAIAKTVVETIYALSQKYKVTGSALINNFLINRGVKSEGFCYHYVDAIRKALSARAWGFYEARWGEAWAGTFRENNALVITARGAPFESGLAIDVWRAAGKPFWTPVAGDRFPWREAHGVEIE